jgi:hypothetical protein
MFAVVIASIDLAEESVRSVKDNGPQMGAISVSRRRVLE